MGVGHHEALHSIEGGVDLAEKARAEGAGFTRAGLRLAKHVTALDQRSNGCRLDSRRHLEAVGINATEKVIREAHVVK